MSGGSVVQYIQRWSEVLGISKEALMRVLVASDSVNEADKQTIQLLLDKIDIGKQEYRIPRIGLKQNVSLSLKKK